MISLMKMLSAVRIPDIKITSTLSRRLIPNVYVRNKRDLSVQQK